MTLQPHFPYRMAHNAQSPYAGQVVTFLGYRQPVRFDPIRRATIRTTDGQRFDVWPNLLIDL